MAKTSSDSDELIGQTLGSYRILAPLGQGGMGTVYVVEHELLGKRAALKMLRRELSAQAELVDRFFNEARAAARIRHAGIVDVYDFGHAPDGSAYLVMELLQGRSLSVRMERGPLDEPLVRELMRQMASALQAAHSAGIIHRDLKPDNVFLVDDPSMPNGVRVKLLDFGIAKLGVLPSESNFGKGSAKQTRTGVVMGTPAYMAPEQWRSASEVDARADLYSLGCVAYELLAGRPPFQADSVLDLLLLHRSSTPVPLEDEANVSPDLVALVNGLLEKDPGDRPDSMHEVVDALDAGTLRERTSPMAQFDVTLDPSSPKLTPPRIGQRTTLSDASGALSGGPIKRPPASGSWVWGVTAAIVVAGIGLAGIVRILDRRVAAFDLPTIAPAAQAPRVEATKVRLSIDSHPQGADVYRAADSALIGRTPLVEQLDQDGATITYLVKHEGYLDERLSFAALRDTETTLSLRPVPPRTPPARSKRTSRPAGPPPAVTPAPSTATPPMKNGVLDPFTGQ